MLCGGIIEETNTLLDIEIFPQVENCQLPGLWQGFNGPTGPSIFQHGTDILLCGSDENACWKLDHENTNWSKFNTLLMQEYPTSSVQMINGTYLFADSKATHMIMEFIAHNKKEWQSGTEIPGNVITPCVVDISDDEFLIIGGYDSDTQHPSGRILKFNTKYKKWTDTAIKLEPELQRHRCYTFNKKVIITGGLSGMNQQKTSVTKIIDIHDNGELKIRQAGNMTENRVDHGMGVIEIDNEYKVIAFGGSDGGTFLNSVEIWNDINETWSKSSLVLRQPKSSFSFGTFPTELLCPNSKLTKN